jgi:hypothetical protein
VLTIKGGGQQSAVEVEQGAITKNSGNRLQVLSQLRSSGVEVGGREKNGPKRGNKAIMGFRINDLTQKTKPKQSQNKAIKSFRFGWRLQNKAKTKPLSPLNCGWVEKQI